MDDYDWKVGALYEILMSDNVLITAPRRSGKTLLCYNYISLLLNEYKDKNIVYITPHRSRSIISDIINTENSDKSGFASLTTYSVKTIKNSKLIISSPVGTFHMGITVDFLILDDFGLYKLDDLTNILKYIYHPMKVIGISDEVNTDAFNLLYNTNPLKFKKIKI